MTEKTTTGLVIQEELDLLVDGELSEERRQALLGQLEEVPDGWRQCALRFLEAQVWREALAEEPVELPGHRRRLPWTSLAAAVLGFLVALTFFSDGTLRLSFGGAEPIASGNPEASERGRTPSSPLDTEVRLLPYPVYTDRGFVPAADERGNIFYRGEGIPAVVLRALQQAGHGVERVERLIHVPRKEGEPLELPVTETRVFLNHEL